MQGIQGVPSLSVPSEKQEAQNMCKIWNPLNLSPFFVLSSVITGMKHPFSPTSRSDSERTRSGGQMDSEPCCEIEDHSAVLEQSPGGALHSSLFKPKRERKQRTYTLCEVCNIQLNSAAQAQVHYSGKSHQKRLKKISNGKMATSTGRPQVLLGFLSRTNKANV